MGAAVVFSDVAGKPTEVGLRVTAGALRAAPVPLSVTVCVPGVASSETVNVAVRVPATVGKNTRFNTQEPFAGTAVPTAHVEPGANVKSPAFGPVIAAGAVKFNGAVDELVSVTLAVDAGVGRPAINSTLLKFACSPPKTTFSPVKAVLLPT